MEWRLRKEIVLCDQIWLGTGKEGSFMSNLFAFQVSPWELFVRGSLIYWFLFFLLRFGLRRDAGSMGLADILVIVLIADAAQNGMSGEYKSVGEAMVLVGTIAAWNYLIDWMSFHYRWFAKLAEPGMVSLICHGSIVRRNLRREMITEEELKSQLRQSGVVDIAQVKRAMLEPDGHISVIRYSKNADDQHRKGGLPGAF